MLLRCVKQLTLPSGHGSVGDTTPNARFQTTCNSGCSHAGPAAFGCKWRLCGDARGPLGRRPLRALLCRRLPRRNRRAGIVRCCGMLPHVACRILCVACLNVWPQAHTTAACGCGSAGRHGVCMSSTATPRPCALLALNYYPTLFAPTQCSSRAALETIRPTTASPCTVHCAAPPEPTAILSASATRHAPVRRTLRASCVLFSVYSAGTACASAQTRRRWPRDRTIAP